MRRQRCRTRAPHCMPRSSLRQKRQLQAVSESELRKDCVEALANLCADGKPASQQVTRQAQASELSLPLWSAGFPLSEQPGFAHYLSCRVTANRFPNRLVVLTQVVLFASFEFVG